MSDNQGITLGLATVMLGVVLLALVGRSCNESDNQRAVDLGKACVEAGGTFKALTGDCIRSPFAE